MFMLKLSVDVNFGNDPSGCTATTALLTDSKIFVVGIFEIIIKFSWLIFLCRQMLETREPC